MTNTYSFVLLKKQFFSIKNEKEYFLYRKTNKFQKTMKTPVILAGVFAIIRIRNVRL